MRSRTATWFETKIKYDKMMENGIMKTVSEQYVVDALSFTEAENQIIEEMSAYISGEFKITNISETAYKEIFFSDDEMADKWYKAKLAFITIDEKTEKEKRSNVWYLLFSTLLPPDFWKSLKINKMTLCSAVFWVPRSIFAPCLSTESATNPAPSASSSSRRAGTAVLTRLSKS